jgi:hypothetical protein
MEHNVQANVMLFIIEQVMTVYVKMDIILMDQLSVKNVTTHVQLAFHTLIVM